MGKRQVKIVDDRQQAFDQVRRGAFDLLAQLVFLAPAAVLEFGRHALRLVEQLISSCAFIRQGYFNSAIIAA